MAVTLLTAHQEQKSIVIIGGAVGDIVLTLAQLPLSGEDIVARAQGQQIGGCAFNVARVLKKLGLVVINGIPVGNGTWGTLVEQEMVKLNLPALLRHKTSDNGWCLALVEPDGERTFITVEGCEIEWENINLSDLPVPADSIVYASGYELAGTTNQRLQHWLLNLPKSVLCFIDPGPRIADIEPNFFNQLLTQNIILTLNRNEIALLCGKSDSPLKQVQHFLVEYPVTVIARIDSKGAWLCQPNNEPVYIPAYRVEVVDTIGAGDAHCGGVIAGLALGGSLMESVRLGNLIAGIIVNRRGADNPPDRAELESFQFIEY